MKKVSLFLVVIMLSSSVYAGVSWGRGGKCQILDREPTPLYSISGAYLEEAEVEAGTETGLFEVEASCGLAYWHDTLGGDIDVHANFESIFFLQTAAIDLPENVSEVSVDFAWINRMQNGWSLIIGLTPGIYSDLETLDSDAFFLPIRLAGVKTFSPTVSGIAGLEYRSGFDRELFPILGIAWQPDRAFRLEVGVPESMILWRPDDMWDVYGKFQWSNVTYDLRDRQNDSRETMTLEDFRNVFGVRAMVDDRIGLFFELGRTYHRSLAFERRNASTVELEVGKGMFGKGGVVGYF